MKNRVGVTVRFNLEEQENLRSLTQFWGMDAKKVLKLGFEQLVTSTKQLQDKLIAREKEANEGTGETNQSSDSSAANQLGDGDRASGSASTDPDATGASPESVSAAAT